MSYISLEEINSSVIYAPIEYTDEFINRITNENKIYYYSKMVKLEDFTNKELKAIARKYNKVAKIAGYSKLKKDELIKKIRGHPNLNVSETEKGVKIKVVGSDLGNVDKVVKERKKKEEPKKPEPKKPEPKKPEPKKPKPKKMVYGKNQYDQPEEIASKSEVIKLLKMADDVMLNHIIENEKMDYETHEQTLKKSIKILHENLKKEGIRYLDNAIEDIDDFQKIKAYYDKTKFKSFLSFYKTMIKN